MDDLIKLGVEPEQDSIPVEGEGEQDTLSLDDLFTTAADDQRIEEAERALLLPGGGYTTVPEMKASRVKYDDGRTVINYWGKITGEKDGFIRFTLSADYRDKVNFETGAVEVGTPDLKFKLFLYAKKAYEKASGEKMAPDGHGDVFKFIRDFPVRLRLMQGDDRNIVLNITPVRE